MPESPGGISISSERTDNGDEENNFFEQTLRGSGDNVQYEPREKGLMSRTLDSKSGSSLLLSMSETTNPKQQIQSLVQLLSMWMKADINPHDTIELNKLTSSLMNILMVAWMEFLYSAESANESKHSLREYDEDEFVSKFCEGDVFSFIENLRDYKSDGSKRLLYFLQNQKLNELRLNDSFSPNRFLRLRSEIIHTCLRVFEYGTLIYYISELKNMKKAFDYTLWYFRNSSLSMDANFRDILMGIMDALIMQNFNSVIDAARDVNPSIFESNSNRHDDGENALDKYFVLKKNQSIACIRRLIIANKAVRLIISPTILESILNRIQEDFECIEDIIDIYQNNTDKFTQDDSEVIHKLKVIISNKWKNSWEANISASSILDAHTSLPSQLNTALPGGASSQSTTNLPTTNVVKFSEWMGIFPECDIFDTLRQIKNNSSEEAQEESQNEWLKDTASDPVHVLSSIQRAIEGLYCNLQSSRRESLNAVLTKEENYKENIKIARMRRQNEGNSTSNPSTNSSSSNSAQFVSPTLLLRTVQPNTSSSSSLSGRRTEHPTSSSQENKRVKRD